MGTDSLNNGNLNKDEINFGPCEVTEHGIKLYNFCRLSFPSFSKRKLRECFMNGFILVNDAHIKAGHDDECRRLDMGDKVRVCLDVNRSEQLKLASVHVDVAHQTEGLVIINKLSGVSVAPGKSYESALKSILWNGQNKATAQIVYHLEKQLNGLVIVAQTHEYCKQIRKMMAVGVQTVDCGSATAVVAAEPDIVLTYRAILCGHVGEPGGTVTISTKYPDMPTITMHITDVSRCRATNYLTTVDIVPTFDAYHMGCADMSEYTLAGRCSGAGVERSEQFSESFLRTLYHPVTGADYKVHHYPTKHLKSIKRALMRAGHAVAGDGGMVTKGKGVYAALISVRINRPVALPPDSSDSAPAGAPQQSYPVVVQIPTPEKFGKLLAREERMWVSALNRDQNVMQAHVERSGRRHGVSAKGSDGVGVNGGSCSSLLTTPNDCGSDSEEECGGEIVGGNESDNDSDTDADDGDDATDSTQSRDGTIRSPLAVAAPGTFSSPPPPRCDSDVPVEYRTGEATFCGHAFAVSPQVMIPRRSSEALVREGVARLVESCTPAGVEHPVSARVQPSLRVLDLGTGSGCLLLSTMLGLLSATTNAIITTAAPNSVPGGSVNVTGLGVDISASALDVARKNAERLGLADSTQFVEGSFETLLSVLQANTSQSIAGAVDLILCNPPYSSFKDRGRLSTSRRSHEPAVALYAPKYTVGACGKGHATSSSSSSSGGGGGGGGGGTGETSSATLKQQPQTQGGTMGAYHMIARSLQDVHDYQCQIAVSHCGDGLTRGVGENSGDLIKVGAHLVLEMGHGQEKQVRAIFDLLPSWRFVHSVRDHLDIVRCVVYRYHGGDSAGR